MRKILLSIQLLALLTSFVPANKASATVALSEQRRAVNASQQKASEIAAIKSYCRKLDQFFRNNPRATRYFVDALPEGQANVSSEAQTPWHEVKDENEMLDAERAYANHSVAISVKDGAIVKAEIVEPREHSRTTDTYYFRSDRTLARVTSDFQSNMQEAHIWRESYYDANGKLLRATAQCFRILHASNGNREKRVTCTLGEMRDEIASHPIPVYQRVANLPGYDTLKMR